MYFAALHIILCSISGGALPAGADTPSHPAFYVGSAYSVGEGNAAVVAKVGWPKAEMGYVMGLKDFFDLTFKVDHEYGKAFRVGLRGMLQMIDLDGWFDMGVLLEPMFYAQFKGDTSAGADITAGVNMGVRPHARVNLFVELVHQSRIASKWEYYTNGPAVRLGIEISLTQAINLLGYGTAKWYWKDLGPEYGGGLGVAFWLR